MLTSIVATIFALGLLIFIHELGHFLLAKRVGIRVEKFSLGFPPNIFSKKVGDTTYCIGAIPLGGYVKMLGENPDEEGKGEAPDSGKTQFTCDEFMSKTVGQRAAVIFAGPFMNYLLAIVLLSGVYLAGRPIFDPDRIILDDIQSGEPADKAGLKNGDQIVALDGVTIMSYDSMRTQVRAHKGNPLALTWVRGNDTLNATITPKIVAEMNEQGGVDSVGVLGFSQKVQRYERAGFVESISNGFIMTHVLVWETAKFLKRLVSGQASIRLVGGPVFIAQQSGREAQKGLRFLFGFIALLSVNLAVLNVLPIPILDGGHLLFLLVEKIKGSPLSVKARGIAQQVGIVFLLGVIVLVTYNDILRAFRGF